MCRQENDGMTISDMNTLRELRQSGYQYKSIKDEIRDNLIRRINKGESSFPGIYGYEETVIPAVERALLAKHNILFLGLRGQAKTKMARMMTHLLDPLVPVIKGAPLHDHPLRPLSYSARAIIEREGDETPIEWIRPEDRYYEKLATPDVTIADLIGDIDPIKAANDKLSFSDELAIHYGLIPRANQSIFVINELPDLQARIQVALLNILEEGDIQIRGFNVRWPIDVFFVFTANPEDYTHRGSIITPLKDRIRSQINTHYPYLIKNAMDITKSQVAYPKHESIKLVMPSELSKLIELFISELRTSDYINPESGVSVRASIAIYEYLMASAERRAIKHGVSESMVRLTDLFDITPALAGKVELSFDGQELGIYDVITEIMWSSIRKLYDEVYPYPDDAEDQDPFQIIKMWFENSNKIALDGEMADEEYYNLITKIPDVQNLVNQYKSDSSEKIHSELLLFGLSFYNIVDIAIVRNKFLIHNMLDDLFNEI